MRKTGPILLVILYLISFTEFHELFSVPRLITHYNEHKIQNRTLDFLSFIVMHYTGSDHKEQHSHDQLPFNDDHCANTITNLTFPLPGLYSVEVVNTGEVRDFTSFYKPHLKGSLVQISIWQPPRI
jgi:hypothetical protein